MKSEVIAVLLSAGFEQSGKDQFVNPIHGRIFMEDYTGGELVRKLMALGKKHKAHEIRKVLEVEEQHSFKPQA